MYERGKCVLPEFGAFEAEDKEHGVKDVGFTVTVGSNDASEMLMKRADDMAAEIRLEVEYFKMADFHEGCHTKIKNYRLRKSSGAQSVLVKQYISHKKYRVKGN